MANATNKNSENVEGKFYVDDQCIDCDLCCQTAPENFVRNESAGRSYVAKQPATAEEEANCEAAMSACPVESIGDDGE